MRLIAEVVGQLDLHRALHQPSGQPAEQPALPENLLLAPRTRKQLVHELIRQLLTHLVRQPLKHPRQERRLA